MSFNFTSFFVMRIQSLKKYSVDVIALSLTSWLKAG